MQAQPDFRIPRRIALFAFILLALLTACSGASNQAETLGEQIGYYDLFTLFTNAEPFIKVIYGAVALALLIIGEQAFYGLLGVTFAILGANFGLTVGRQIDPGGSAVGTAVDFDPGQSTVQTISFLLGLGLGGAAGVLLTRFIYGVALFAVGAVLGIGITAQLWMQFSTEPVSAVALIVGGIVCGILMALLSLFLGVLASSLVGAILLAAVLELNAIWMVIFFIAGVVIQYIIAVLRKRQETFLVRWARRQRVQRR